MENGYNVEVAYEVFKEHMLFAITRTAQWLSWLERRPVTAEVTSSSLVWVDFFD